MKWVAAAGLTVTVPEMPLIVAVTVSVAVMVWLPALFRVAGKVPVPLVRAALAGSTAAVSEPVKWSVPAYPVALLLN